MLHPNDLREVYQSVEETIGINAGVNNVVFNIKGVIGAGAGHATRYYYVPVYFPNVDPAVRFRAVLLTMRPLSAPYRFSGAMLAVPGVAAPLGYPTYSALIAAIAAAPVIANDTSPAVSAVANMTIS